MNNNSRIEMGKKLAKMITISTNNPAVIDLVAYWSLNNFCDTTAYIKVNKI